MEFNLLYLSIPVLQRFFFFSLVCINGKLFLLRRLRPRGKTPGRFWSLISCIVSSFLSSQCCCGVCLAVSESVKTDWCFFPFSPSNFEPFVSTQWIILISNLKFTAWFLWKLKGRYVRKFCTVTFEEVLSVRWYLALHLFNPFKSYL